ncbi:flagellar motor switch protein FliN [bacterium]|nr:flagellar motor switch protein FliN [bacterium]
MAIDPRYNQLEEAGLSIMQDVFGPILNRPVTLERTGLDDAAIEVFAEMFDETPVVVEAPLEGALDAVQYFVFSQRSAAGVTDLMVMGDGTAPFNEHESLDGIAEAVNQIVGAQATSWSEELKADVRSGGAQGRLNDVSELDLNLDEYILVTYKISIEDWGEDTFVKLMPRSVYDLLVELSEGEEEDDEFSMDSEAFAPSPASGPRASAPPPGGGQKPAARPNVKQAQFGEFDVDDVLGAMADGPQNLDLLLDISLPVTIELGRTNMLIRDVLEIGPGSVVELQKLSGEPVDLYINDKRFALGEVVVIDENFGIRITELLSVEDRIKALK